MSAPIGPGDWVECIYSEVDPFRIGRLFCVDSVCSDGVECPAGHGPCDGLLFDGEVFDGTYYWAACCYKPIYRPKAELIQGLLRPTDAPVEPGLDTPTKTPVEHEVA